MYEKKENVMYNKKDEIKFADDSWAIYESNLQAYRSGFLSSQSIMLAVGAILIDKNMYVVIIIAFIAVLQIIYVWIPVIHYRALLVDFHKYRMDEKFDCNGEWKEETKNSRVLTELIYCKNKKIRTKVNYLLSKHVARERPFSNWRETRRKIDIVIPLSMIVIWVIYIFVALGIIK